MKRKIDIQKAPISSGSRYPESFAAPCQDKIRRRLAVAAGLKHIGINLLELAPGAWSSQRHWHTLAEEFVYVLEGEVVLVTEGSVEILARAIAPPSLLATPTDITCKIDPASGRWFSK